MHSQELLRTPFTTPVYLQGEATRRDRLFCKIAGWAETFFADRNEAYTVYQNQALHIQYQTWEKKSQEEIQRRICVGIGTFTVIPALVAFGIKYFYRLCYVEPMLDRISERKRKEWSNVEDKMKEIASETCAWFQNQLEATIPYPNEEYALFELLLSQELLKKKAFLKFTLPLEEEARYRPCLRILVQTWQSFIMQAHYDADCKSLSVTPDSFYALEEAILLVKGARLIFDGNFYFLYPEGSLEGYFHPYWIVKEEL